MSGGNRRPGGSPASYVPIPTGTIYLLPAQVRAFCDKRNGSSPSGSAFETHF